jgi:hypothetical protein
MRAVLAAASGPKLKNTSHHVHCTQGYRLQAQHLDSFFFLFNFWAVMLIHFLKKICYNSIHTFLFSAYVSKQKYNVGQINSTELTDAIWKNFFQGKLTFAHWTKGGEAMAPIVSPTGGTLLVRKLANLSPT